MFSRDGGSDVEVDILAVADAPEVGFLVVGDVVVVDVEGRQCPDGRYGRCTVWTVQVLANVQIQTANRSTTCHARAALTLTRTSGLQLQCAWRP